MPPSAREFAEFNALLHSVVEKGLPLPPAIHLMAGVVRDPSLREALGGVARDLGDGASLADALGRFPDVFPPDYCARVRAGAEGGRLAEILRAAQIEHEFRARARSRMTRLLIYLLAGAIIGEIVIGLTLLMGRQVNLFNALILDQMQIVSKHPLLELLDAALDSGWILLGAWPGLILLALLAHRLLERSARAGGLGYLIPVWGRIRKSRDLAAFCSTLGLRLRSGLAMVPALRAAREAVRTRKFHAMTDRLIHRVEEGESLSSALFYLNFFPRTLAWGVSLAEENGEVPKTFDAFADLYTREMDRHFTILQELLTPLGMLVIGNVALLSALMVLAPFFQIITIQTSLSSSSSGGMEDSLKIAIGLTTLNLLFLAFLQVSYLLVSRRRLKISLLVEHLATLAR
ncbi:MAG: type II secretion system F family protein, partial [Planctomycetes bacterium]|nr:type II secretion system F family protein [Planctomycetota bacterium]